MNNVLIVSNRRIENAHYFSGIEDLAFYLGWNGRDVDTLIFAFWSWKVKPEMLKNYKCYGLHTGPLLTGKGKGGSPIDNLKRLGVKWTTLCSFKMTEEIDGGQIQTAAPIYIGDSKEDIIKRIDGMIPDIVKYLTIEQPIIPERFKRV